MAWRFDAEDAQLGGCLFSFLHDAPCTWTAESCDSASQRLVITAYRPRHEAPRRWRVLGVVSVTRSTYPFSYVEFNDSILRICFEGGTVEAQLDGWAPIELRDVGPPSERPAINTISVGRVWTPNEWENELRQRWFDA